MVSQRIANPSNLNKVAQVRILYSPPSSAIAIQLVNKNSEAGKWLNICVEDCKRSISG